jgi:glycosyltransferase involved in cell wall biosynthesis
MDRKSWSGSMYYLYNALKDHVGEVEFLKLESTPSLELTKRVVSKMRRILRVPGNITQSVPLSMAYGAMYRKAILASGCDVVFAPAASTEIAYLRSPVPVVYYSDTTFRAMENYYYPLEKMHPITRWEGNHIEGRAITRSDIAVYSSPWAAESAVKHYGVDPGKIRIITFGANMDEVPTRESLRQGSTDGRCRLLFVGRDWERKGGQIAVDALLALRRRGIDAELTIIGCTPEPEFTHPSLHVIPYLDKHRPEQRAELADFYLNSDIFFLPTRAECSGVVFCEASANGLPVVSTDTGGVSSVVVEGVNGYLLPIDAGAEAYAETLARLWADPATRQKLRQTSRDRYETTLNWTAWAVAMKKVFGQAVAGR